LSISDKVVVMESGVIQQVGTPEEIYRSPQTRFVATFIGTANQFFGQVEDSNTVHVNEFHLQIDELKNFLKGQKVVVLVRPEYIQVSTQKPEKNGCNIIEGTVETITFHGAVTRLGVNANDQRIVADINVAETEPVALNKKVWLMFGANACKVMAVDK